MESLVDPLVDPRACSLVDPRHGSQQQQVDLLSVGHEAQQAEHLGYISSAAQRMRVCEWHQRMRVSSKEEHMAETGTILDRLTVGQRTV